MVLTSSLNFVEQLLPSLSSIYTLKLYPFFYGCTYEIFLLRRLTWLFIPFTIIYLLFIGWIVKTKIDLFQEFHQNIPYASKINVNKQLLACYDKRQSVIRQQQLIEGMIFNNNKQDLLLAINQKIASIDNKCDLINHQIYQYSEEKIQAMTQNAKNLQKEVTYLSKQKVNKQSMLAKLMNDLAYLQQEQRNLKEQSIGKQGQIQTCVKQIAFIEQRYKQEQPHMQSFITEKAKSSSNNIKVKYAHQKLNKLNKQFNKECQSVQYQYRLNKIIRQQLKQLQQPTQQSGQRNEGSKQAKGTANSINSELHKNTELSEYNDSIITSFRDS